MTTMGPGGRAGRAAFRVIVTGLVTTMTIAIGIGFVNVAFGLTGEMPWQFFSCACMLAIMFAVSTAAATVMRRGRLIALMSLAVAAEVVATVLVLHLIVDSETGSPWFGAVFKAAVACAMVGIALAHSGVFSLVRTSSRLLLVTKVFVMACVWLAVVVWTGYAIVEQYITNWMVVITIAASGMIVTVLALLGTIIVPVAAYGRADRDITAVESVERRLRIELECPQCRQMQDVPTGSPRCRACRAWLTVEVEEPRCACGYLLYQLSGDYCPECGASIPAELRWDTWGQRSKANH